MQTLNNTQQRWLALGILLAVIISIALLIIMPWLNTLSEINDDFHSMQLILAPIHKK